jgi:lysophospholipase L1-like esterase
MRRFGTVLLLAASLLLVLAAIEGFLRLANLQVTEYAYNLRKYGGLITYDAAGDFTRHTSNGSAAVWGVTMRFNAAGMRDVDHTAEKAPGVLRVLVLGDSVAAGLGVPFEETFVRRLGPLLAASRGRSVEVIAAAVPGWNTIAERNYLRAEGLGLRPDVVLLVYVTNDNAVSLPWAPAPPPSTSTRILRWLTGHSRLAELVAYAYRQRWPAAPDAGKWQMLRDMKAARERRESEPHIFEPDDPGWLASRRALEDIASMTHAAHVTFAIVLFNLGGPDSPAVTSRLAEFSAATGVPWADSLPWFAGREATTLLNSSLHPNAEAHAILAAGMARTIAKLALGNE